MIAAHCSEDIAPGAGVGQQVDQHVVGVQGEQVVAGRGQRLLALLARREAQRLHRLDAERLDDGALGHDGDLHVGPPEPTWPPWPLAGARGLRMHPVASPRLAQAAVHAEQTAAVDRRQKQAAAR
jgi:hypothetical protein